MGGVFEEEGAFYKPFLCGCVCGASDGLCEDFGVYVGEDEVEHLVRVDAAADVSAALEVFGFLFLQVLIEAVGEMRSCFDFLHL